MSASADRQGSTSGRTGLRRGYARLIEVVDATPIAIRVLAAIGILAILVAAAFLVVLVAMSDLRSSSDEQVRANRVTASTLAGEAITSRLTRAPGNDAPIGGLKVTAQSGWFAARPSGTENIYKIYAESFRDEAHLDRILREAQEIVRSALEPTG